MIRNLITKGFGPAPEIDVKLGSRLNIITGDNGLGKSFILDILWFALAGYFPADLNPTLTAGLGIVPFSGNNHSDKSGKQNPEILISLDSDEGGVREEFFRYDKQLRVWRGNNNSEEPVPYRMQHLSIYFLCDGSICVFNPYTSIIFDEVLYRMMYSNKRIHVMNLYEVWNGLKDENGTVLCKGLIADWSAWQSANGAPFDYLQRVLRTLSPSEKEILQPGELTRARYPDVRDIPTIKMPYNQEVPVIYLSSGIQKILTFSYLLVWAWHEHQILAKRMEIKPISSITLIIDEIESHLHPKWQRTIVRPLIKAATLLQEDINVQLIASTHSPLIMNSIEEFFDSSQDAWIDMDLDGDTAVIRNLDFEKQGDVSNWLTSGAFDLKSDRALNTEILIDKASKLIEEPNPDKQAVQNIYEDLVKTLPYEDNFLFTWRYMAKQKGLIE
jgi:hypothetical protein